VRLRPVAKADIELDDNQAASAQASFNFERAPSFL
jgi:hypothetical protein